MRQVFAALAFAGLSTVAHAQSHAWVEPVAGSGTTCTAASPCAQLQQAFNYIGDAGMVYLYGQGPVGTATLTKSVRIQGNDGAQINSLIINAPGKRVVIKGVQFDKGISADWGIRVIAADSLALEDVTFTSSAGGILFTPSNGGALSLKNVNFADSSSGSNAAIRVATSGRNVNVSLDNVNVFAGVGGVYLDGTSPGFLKFSAKDSTFTNIGGAAIQANAVGGYVRLYVDGVTAVNNTSGIVGAGAGVIGWIGESTLAGNGTGVGQTNGARLMSFKNNYIYNNNTDGIPLPDSWSPPASVGSPSPSPSSFPSPFVARSPLVADR